MLNSCVFTACTNVYRLFFRSYRPLDHTFPSLVQFDHFTNMFLVHCFLTVETQFLGCCYDFTNTFWLKWCSKQLGCRRVMFAVALTAITSSRSMADSSALIANLSALEQPLQLMLEPVACSGTQALQNIPQDLPIVLLGVGPRTSASLLPNPAQAALIVKNILHNPCQSSDWLSKVGLKSLPTFIIHNVASPDLVALQA
jgi:hypothetical protein